MPMKVIGHGVGFRGGTRHGGQTRAERKQMHCSMVAWIHAVEAMIRGVDAIALRALIDHVPPGGCPRMGVPCPRGCAGERGDDED